MEYQLVFEINIFVSITIFKSIYHLNKKNSVTMVTILRREKRKLI